ncbi:hypothetical protein V8E36_008542 [Tilletia maclaganii]
MATPHAHLNSQDTEMSTSTPVVLDPSVIPPGAKYAPIYSDALGDGPLEAGRVLYLPDPTSMPLTFFEARGLMAHTGKTVGPLSILYQVIGKKFDPRQKADTDRLERAMLKRLSEKAGSVWDNKKAPRIKFPPSDPQGRTAYATAQFTDLVVFKACRGHDLQNGVQKLRHAFSGPPTSPRVFVISVHVEDTAYPGAVALQLRSHLCRAATVHAVWALDRGNVQAGQVLECTGLILAVATFNGNPAVPPQLHEWHNVVPWLEVGDQQYPTAFNYRPAHCSVAQCRRPDVTFHQQSACRHLRCHNCGETGHLRHACPEVGSDAEESKDHHSPRPPAAAASQAQPQASAAGVPQPPAATATSTSAPASGRVERPAAPIPQPAVSIATTTKVNVPVQAPVSSFIPATPPSAPRATVATNSATSARRAFSTSVTFAEPLVQERPRPLSTSSAPDLHQASTADKGKRRAEDVFSPSTSEDSIQAQSGARNVSTPASGTASTTVQASSAQPKASPLTRHERIQRSPRKQICVGPRREVFEDQGSSDSQDTQRDSESQPAPASVAAPAKAFRVPGTDFLVGNSTVAAQPHKRVLKTGDGTLRWETPTPQSSQSQ